MGDKMTPAERSELFQKSIASKEDREQFAETWAAMINEVLPVETSVRNIFTVEQVPAGAVPVYAADVQPISAWFLPKYGQAPTNIIEIEEVTVPTFELVGKVEYKLRDAKHGRINVADRAMQRLLDSMIEQEENAGWAVLKAAAAATAVDGATVSTNKGLDKNLVAACFKQMESNRGYKVTDIYVSPSGMADIRLWSDTDVDPVTRREIFQAAGLSGIWDATFHVVHFLGADEAYFIDATPNKLGYMPVREELKTWDNPASLDKFRIGTVAYEEVGFVVMDSKAIVKATVDNA